MQKQQMQMVQITFADVSAELEAVKTQSIATEQRAEAAEQRASAVAAARAASLSSSAGRQKQLDDLVAGVAEARNRWASVGVMNKQMANLEKNVQMAGSQAQQATVKLEKLEGTVLASQAESKRRTDDLKTELTTALEALQQKQQAYYGEQWASSADVEAIERRIEQQEQQRSTDDRDTGSSDRGIGQEELADALKTSMAAVDAVEESLSQMVMTVTGELTLGNTALSEEVQGMARQIAQLDRDASNWRQESAAQAQPIASTPATQATKKELGTLRGDLSGKIRQLQENMAELTATCATATKTAQAAEQASADVQEFSLEGLQKAQDASKDLEGRIGGQIAKLAATQHSETQRREALEGRLQSLDMQQKLMLATPAPTQTTKAEEQEQEAAPVLGSDEIRAALMAEIQTSQAATVAAFETRLTEIGATNRQQVIARDALPVELALF